MDPHRTLGWKPLAVPLTQMDAEAEAMPGSLFERQGVLLRAIQQQARLRTRTMAGPAGRVAHLINARPEDTATADDGYPRKVTIATVTQIGSHTSRPYRGAPRLRARGERDDRVD